MMMIGWRQSGASGRRSDRVVQRRRLIIEALEGRALLTTGPGLLGVSARAAVALLATAPVIQGTTIVPVVNQPFTGKVASFTDLEAGHDVADYRAVINWGDRTTEGQVISNLAGGFDVVGSNTFTATGQATVTVQVFRLTDGQSGTARSAAIVVSASDVLLTGQLDPTVNTGGSATVGITNINQPTFRGTAAPYTVVQLLARPVGQGILAPLGRTVTGPDGRWSLTTGPLLDGVYLIYANIVPPDGFPQTTIPLSPGNRLVIDTAAPRVIGLSLDLVGRQILVGFQDHLSGLNLATLLNPANYALFGPGFRTATPKAVTLFPSAVATTADPRVVAISLDGIPWRPATIRGLRIVGFGIRDAAGNPLDGAFHKTYPSGNGHPGTNFVVHFPRPVVLPTLPSPFAVLGRRR